MWIFVLSLYVIPVQWAAVRTKFIETIAPPHAFFRPFILYLTNTWGFVFSSDIFTESRACDTCQGRPSIGTFWPPMMRLKSRPPLLKLLRLSESASSTFGEINPHSSDPSEAWLADAINKKITATILNCNWAEKTQRCTQSFFLQEGLLLAQSSPRNNGGHCFH